MEGLGLDGLGERIGEREKKELNEVGEEAGRSFFLVRDLEENLVTSAGIEKSERGG